MFQICFERGRRGEVLQSHPLPISPLLQTPEVWWVAPLKDFNLARKISIPEGDLYVFQCSQSPDLPLPHGLAPSETMVWDHGLDPPLSTENPRNKGFGGFGAPHFWIWSRRPCAQGVGVDPCLLKCWGVFGIATSRDVGPLSPQPYKSQRPVWLDSARGAAMHTDSANATIHPTTWLAISLVPYRGPEPPQK